MAFSVDKYILEGPKHLYEPSEGGLGYEIFYILKLYKDRLAQQIIDTGEENTYGNILEKSAKTAIHLSQKNLRHDDVICLLSENRDGSFISFIATQFIGATFTSGDPAMPEADLIYFFDYIQPKVLFVSEHFEQKVEDCLKRTNVKCDIIILGKSSNNVTFSEIQGSQMEWKQFNPTFVKDLKRTALIFLSSGTTGKPKGICSNHYAMLRQIFLVSSNLFPRGTFNSSSFSLEFEDKKTPRFMLYSPMFWMSHPLLTLGVFFVGGVMIIGSKFNAPEMLGAMLKYEPSALFLPPGQANELCHIISSRNEPISCVDAFFVGGGLVTASHMQNIKTSFSNAKVVQAYGQTENTGVLISFNISDEEEMKIQDRKPSSCGRVLAGIKVKIVDLDTGKLCGPNEQGELRTIHPYLMNGYYKMSSESEFDSDDWLMSGDLAYYDDNQNIFIIDRIKDLLLYTVYNIRPSVIESILADHPSVLECFVFGKPHPTDNEHPTGVVVLKKGLEYGVAEADLVEYVNNKVPSERYKIRGGIKFLENMLITGSGKLRKLEMKKLILSEEL